MKLETKMTQYLEQVTQPGLYTIREVKPQRQTRYGRALPVVLSNAKGQEVIMLLPYPTEITDRTNLGRLVRAYGDETDQWIKKKVEVTIYENGRRRIEAVPK